MKLKNRLQWLILGKWQTSHNWQERHWSGGSWEAGSTLGPTTHTNQSASWGLVHRQATTDKGIIGVRRLVLHWQLWYTTHTNQSAKQLVGRALTKRPKRSLLCKSSFLLNLRRPFHNHSTLVMVISSGSSQGLTWKTIASITFRRPLSRLKVTRLVKLNSEQIMLADRKNHNKKTLHFWQRSFSLWMSNRIWSITNVAEVTNACSYQE